MNYKFSPLTAINYLQNMANSTSDSDTTRSYFSLAEVIKSQQKRITELEAQLKDRDRKIAEQSVALRSYVNRYNNTPKEQDDE